MCLHNHLCLKHTDSQTLLLRRLERTKQRISHERRAHATSVVRYRQADPSILRSGCYFDVPVSTNGIACVQQQVRHHTAELFRVPDQFGKGLKFFCELDPGGSIETLHRLFHQPV